MRAHRLLIPFAALLATLPLLLKGPSCGHDFDFHLLSWLEAATQLAHGGYPHWAFTSAWNAGEPRFLFYPPLSWLLGGLLGILHLPWTLVPAAYTFLCLTLAGFTAHRLARRYASPDASLLAAALYPVNPYLLFCAYERAAYGELLAAAWFPLLLLAAFAAPAPAPKTKTRTKTRPGPARHILAIAIPIALLWLTNAPAAVMGCYALALLTTVRLLEPARRALALTTVAGTTLGLALPAFYLLPAAYERPFIQSQLATVPGMRPIDSTLFHRMTPVTADTLYHDQVVHAASVLALLLLATLCALLVFNAVRGSKSVSGMTLPTRPTARSIACPTAALALLIAFLLTPWSLPLWTHTPQLAYLQFPWRLCALLAPLLIVPAAQAFAGIPNLSKYAIPAALTLAATFVIPASRAYRQPCDLEDSVPARVALFHSPEGTEATDEYTPAAADQDQLAPHDPPFWLLPAATDVNAAAPRGALPGPVPGALQVTAAQPEILVLNRRAYPAWQLLVNGRPIAPLERNDGLLAVLLPAGKDTVTLIFRQTPDRTLGLLLTLAALLCAAALSLRRPGRQTAQ